MNPFLWSWLHHYQNNVYFCPICNTSLSWNEATVNLFCSVSFVIPFFHALFLGRTNIHQHSHTFIAVAMGLATGLNIAAPLLSGSMLFTAPSNTGWTSAGIPPDECSWWTRCVGGPLKASQHYATGVKRAKPFPSCDSCNPWSPCQLEQALSKTLHQCCYFRGKKSHKAQAPSALPVGGSLPALHVSNLAWLCLSQKPLLILLQNKRGSTLGSAAYTGPDLRCEFSALQGLVWASFHRDHPAGARGPALRTPGSSSRR